jgi:schlafen family protein
LVESGAFPISILASTVERVDVLEALLSGQEHGFARLRANARLTEAMRSPPEWTKEELDELIRDGVAESLLLDYKGSDSLDRRNSKAAAEICKDVSAFANSAGGTLVYGMTEKNRIATGFDGGVDPAEVSIEWIQQCVYGEVQPRVEGLSVHGVEIRAGRFAYVAHVPQGRTAHMSDGRYYKRHDGQSIAMEDYEVRDTMRRASTPDVVLDFSDFPTANAFDLQIQARNRSATPAKYFVAFLYLGPGLSVTNADTTVWHSGGTRRVMLGVDEVPLTRWRCDWFDRMPLFEGTPQTLTSTTMRIGARYGEVLLWETRAPGRINSGGFVVSSQQPARVLEPFQSWSWVPESEREER